MRFASGWFHVGRWRGADVRLHWSVPVGAVVLGRFEFVPVFWLLFPVVVLVHELGHAWMVARVRCEVVSIDAHAFGGGCAWHGEPTRFERACIAWGGVLAQAGLFVTVALAEALFRIPWSPAAEQAHAVLLGWNAWILLLNLLPIRPLDGAEAWPIVPMLLRRLVAWLRRPRAAPPLREAEPARKVIPFGDRAPTGPAEAARLAPYPPEKSG